MEKFGARNRWNSEPLLKRQQYTRGYDMQKNRKTFEKKSEEFFRSLIEK